MENGPSQERQLHSESSEILEKREIDSLAERLGFIETTELRLIREQAVQSFLSDETQGVRDLLVDYQSYGEHLVDSLEGSEYTRGQIGLIVAKATLYRDTGNIGAFLDAVEDATDYAFNVGEEETVALLEKAPSGEIARRMSAIGEEFGFDAETCAEIAAEPYAEAFETAYSYLMQAGLDADVVLAPFMKNSQE